LVAAGIVAANPARSDGDTGLCVVMVDDAAERTFITSPGVETLCTVGDLDRSAPTSADLVAVSGYDLAYPQSGATLAEWLGGLPAGCRVALDPGPMVSDIPSIIRDSVLATLDILTLNRREAGLLAGAELAGDGHAELRAAIGLPPGVLLVIRSGAAGSTVDGGPDRFPVTVVPTPTVVAVDTTGAGDAHTGVFLANVVQSRGVLESLRRANVAGAVSVTRPGPAEAPTAQEIDAIVEAL
jgi:sugar/nucleoside kinase (ribokinase family)